MPKKTKEVKEEVLTTLQEILRGLELIQSHEPDASLRAEHDEIWVDGEESKDNMTPEQLLNMETWGWDYDESAYGWHRYV